MLSDLRFALRMLSKNPGFTILAWLSLAIGIGINSTAFSVVDALFLRSLPMKNPKQMVWIDSMRQGQGQSFSYPEYTDICRQNTAFAGIVASSRHAAQLDRNGELEMIRADLVSENYFSVLGINATIGRTFVEGEDLSGRQAPPAVISHGLWQRRFGADPGIIGKTVVFNKQNVVVRGVAPQSFGGLQRIMATEVWFPVTAWVDTSHLQDRQYRDYDLLGRLNPGMDIERARAELGTIAQRLASAYPDTSRGTRYIASSEEERIQRSLIPATISLAPVFLILVICSTNVSGMILARAEGRKREIAVRLALGAGRRRVLRQLLTESTLIALSGAGLGLILTRWLINLFPSMVPPGPFVIRFDFRVDGRVMFYALFTCVAASLLAGMAPALQASRADVATTLKSEAGRSERGGWWPGLRSLLVAAQVALSLTLLIATGLFLKSLFFSQQINPGFDTTKKLLIVSPSKVSSNNFYLQVIEHIRSLPGVKASTYAKRMLLSGSGGGVSCEASIPGMEPPAGQKGFVIKYNSVGRDYFRTVGANLIRGRDFDKHEEVSDQRVVLINETMASRFWPNSDPMGRSLAINGRDYQIIGIAQDGRVNQIHETPEPYLYFPFAQALGGEGSIIVETAGDPLALAGAVKMEIHAADKEATLLQTETLKDLMGYALYEDRMIAILSGSLGVLGIILAAIGLYGVVAYLARQLTHEIGIRMALGAHHRDILGLVVGKGLRVAFIGIPIGLVVSIAVMRLLANMLYGVAPTDMWVFAGSSMAVLAVSLLATYIPARRAAKVDPMEALRYE